MDINEIATEMWRLQKRLNENSNKRPGVKRNWGRAIRQEIAETIESFPWKWWKGIDQEPDWDNILIEYIDILHFLISDYQAQFEEEIGLKRFISDLESAIHFNHDAAEVVHKIFPEWDNYKLYDYIIKQLEKIVYESFKLDAAESLYEEMYFLIKAIYLSNFDFEIIVKIYFGKNVLNRFRQDHGYAEGTYKKIWDRREDNEYLLEICRRTELKNVNGFMNNVYGELLKKYKEIT